MHLSVFYIDNEKNNKKNEENNRKNEENTPFSVDCFVEMSLLLYFLHSYY